MFEEMRSRFVIIVLAGVAVISVSIVLQATGNAVLNSVVTLLAFYAAMIAFCGYYFKKAGMKMRQTVSFRGMVRWLLPVLGLTVLVMVFSMSIYWLLLRILLPVSPALVEIALTRQPLPDALWYLAATGFIIAVIAPIAEELLFRGVILNRLMALLGFWKGLLLASLIFGVFHLNFLGAFVFAIVASLLYLKTGNLLAPILLHVANNTISVYQSFANPAFPEWLAVLELSDLTEKSAPSLIVLLSSSALLLFLIIGMSGSIQKTGAAEPRRSPGT